MSSSTPRIPTRTIVLTCVIAGLCSAGRVSTCECSGEGDGPKAHDVMRFHIRALRLQRAAEGIARFVELAPRGASRDARTK